MNRLYNIKQILKNNNIKYGMIYAAITQEELCVVHRYFKSTVYYYGKELHIGLGSRKGYFLNFNKFSLDIVGDCNYLYIPYNFLRPYLVKITLNNYKENKC